MKKIDIHVHTRIKKGILRQQTGSTYATPEELKIMYEKLGVEKGVIQPSLNPEGVHQVQSNEEVMEIVEKYPGLFEWFCHIDPRLGSNSKDTDFSYYINYYREHGAKGVGEICANLYFDDPRVESLFYHCEKTGMSVLFHIGPQEGGCYGLIDELGLYRFEKELAKFPGLQFIGHSQPFWAEIGTDVTEENRRGYPSGKVNPGRLVELFRKYPNLYGDLSSYSGHNALMRDSEFGFRFIEEFQDRLYYGTDICAPENDLRLSFWLDDAVKDGKISEIAYRKVSRENAEILLYK